MHTIALSYVVSNPPQTIPTYHSSFFFNAPATTEIYTLSLHDALPIFLVDDDALAIAEVFPLHALQFHTNILGDQLAAGEDRKSTRLNSSHSQISYAVFCLKKKKIKRLKLRKCSRKLLTSILSFISGSI